MNTKLSISNIAWDTSLDDEVSKLLLKHGVSCIDIAPGKYFSNFSTCTDKEILVLKNKWQDRGFSIIGMQSLLYGTKGLNLFSESAVQTLMLEHLRHVCRIGAELGAIKLVFGSPKNRDRTGLSEEQTLEIAYDFFYQLGEIAKQQGVIICLEPNPECYGANFLTTTLETYSFVRQLNHSNIQMQLDTGSMFINKEPFSLLDQIRDFIGHIHISEPNLQPIGSESVNHLHMAKALDGLDHLPRTIEMLTKNNPLLTVENSVAFTQKIYGGL